MNGVVSSPSGRAEVHDALCLLQGLAGVAPRAPVGAGKGHDTADIVRRSRRRFHDPGGRKVLGTALNWYSTRHAGACMSPRYCKKIEEVFGWLDTVDGLRNLKDRGTARVDWVVIFACAAYNLVRF